MVDQAALLRACAQFARTILRHYDIGEVLHRLTDEITATLEASGAGVSLATRGQLRFVAATDARVAAVEEAQRDIGEGPSHQAWLTGEVVVERDLARSARWPSYVAVALTAGQRAVAGVPMTVADQSIGAVNVYHSRPYDWPAEDLDAAKLLADMAAGYVVNEHTLQDSEELASQLQQALDTRVLIEQAKGILAERHRLDVDAAFERLRHYARSRRRALHAVARDVVERGLDP